MPIGFSEVGNFGWLLFFFGVAAMVRILPALFLASYIRFEGRESWFTTLTIAVNRWVFCSVLFHPILIIPWPQTVVRDLCQGVRARSCGLNLF